MMTASTKHYPEAIRKGTWIKDTVSLCPDCLKKIPARVAEWEGQVWMFKSCDCTGQSRAFEVMLSSDVRHYHRKSVRGGGCGTGCCCAPTVAPASQSDADGAVGHSCNVLIEITQQCNLTCPACYASSSPSQTEYLSVNDVARLADELVQRGHGDADVVQLSGGEPTLHPQLPEIIETILARGFRKLYLNTNGIRLARDDFANTLEPFAEKLGVYLQFDGMKRDTYRILRGRAELLDDKLKAWGQCERLGIDLVPTMTVARGINDDELGEFLKRSASSNRVDKVMIQPAIYSGRYLNPQRIDRLGVADVAKAIAEQTGTFSEADFGPIPCGEPNCFSMALALKTPKGLLPVSRYFPRPEQWEEGSTSELIQAVSDSFDDAKNLRAILEWVGTAAAEALPDEALDALLDQVALAKSGADQSNWKGLFAIGIKPFMDAYTYDQDRIDECCVHIVSRDGTPVSFCEYNAINRPLGQR